MSRNSGSLQPQLSPSDRPLIREDWISACRFHELDETQVLQEVATRVAQVRAQAAGRREAHPLVLLDLDSTLYEVGTRTYRILQEWTESEESRPYQIIRQAVLRAEPWHVGYSVRDTLRAIGVAVDAQELAGAIDAIKNFWAARFFSSSYLQYDRAYPGAADFARKVHELGAEIVYLTGRDEPGMGDGTRMTLKRDGFPWETERTHLLLKKAAHLPDLDHKKEAAHYIRKHGTLVASFENEPPNLVALQELFPEAMHVFVDTVCSDHPALPAAGLYRIKGFDSHTY